MFNIVYELLAQGRGLTNIFLTCRKMYKRGILTEEEWINAKEDISDCIRIRR